MIDFINECYETIIYFLSKHFAILIYKQIIYDEKFRLVSIRKHFLPLLAEKINIFDCPSDQNGSLRSVSQSADGAW